MNGNIIGSIIIVILIIAGGWFLFSSRTAQAPTVATSTPSTMETATSTPPTNVTVTYTDQGFSPAEVSIVEGSSVTFVNQSSRSMWVASAPHPSHQGYDGTTRSQHCVAGYTSSAPFDECASAPLGGSFTFTFTKAGTWGYHNHALSDDGGKVIVTAASSTETSVKASVTL